MGRWSWFQPWGRRKGKYKERGWSGVFLPFWESRRYRSMAGCTGPLSICQHPEGSMSRVREDVLRLYLRPRIGACRRSTRSRRCHGSGLHSKFGLVFDSEKNTWLILGPVGVGVLLPACPFECLTKQVPSHPLKKMFWTV